MFLRRPFTWEVILSILPVFLFKPLPLPNFMAAEIIPDVVQRNLAPRFEPHLHT